MSSYSKKKTLATITLPWPGVDSTHIHNWATSAMGAVASASSNYANFFPPSNALDGDVTSFFHTNDDVNAWWLVDFRQDRLISSVELVNRQDCGQNRLSNFRVTVEDASGLVVASQDFYPISGAVAAAETWTLPQTVAGRRVKIQSLGLNRDHNHYLHLAEVKALGPDVTLKNWAREPVAVATQSTAYSASFPAANAIDGNANTIHHTSSVAGSWLQVDLGADRLVDSVELFNRRDCGQNRLSNFRVSVLDASDAVLVSKDFYSTTGHVEGALRWELPQAVSGRRVKVELLGTNSEGTYYLHIAEINVWGRSDSAVTARGLRGLVSAEVMSSYVPSLSDDRDDDGIPNDLELANGLNPDDATDALADFDHDGINNLTEIHVGSNPQQWNSVPGVLVDEIWHHIPGDNLTAAGYKAANTHYPDEIHTLTTSQAFAHGEQYVRRVRGYLTAPVAGDYQFWGAADSDVDLFLSTSTSKFDRQLILDNKVLSWGENYDLDLSQKSRLVTLAAGQKYYFEIWHKEGIGGSSVSVAWKTPTGSRELIPSLYLSSFGGDPNDLDDDGLKDDYELANGLSITDDGRSPGSRDGAYGDLDGDGLTNYAEMKAGTKANRVDSDGDGVSDYDEANFFDSSTLASDIGAFTPRATLAGDAYTASFGEWLKSGGKALQSCRRGSVTYPITVATSGLYALKFAISSIADGTKNEQYEFDLKLNGKRISIRRSPSSQMAAPLSPSSAHGLKSEKPTTSSSSSITPTTSAASPSTACKSSLPAAPTRIATAPQTGSISACTPPTASITAPSSARPAPPPSKEMPNTSTYLTPTAPPSPPRRTAASSPKSPSPPAPPLP
jgi:F5/8 type C domain/PA14 domain